MTVDMGWPPLLPHSRDDSSDTDDEDLNAWLCPRCRRHSTHCDCADYLDPPPDLVGDI